MGVSGIQCPHCGNENLENRKFCRQCGKPLVLTCPECGFGNGAQDLFCGECGRSLGSPRSATNIPVESIEPEGERKQITLFFSDVEGYTDLSEQLDPEEVREIMSRVFGEIARIVARYGGRVEKLIGDAAMVIFGVPQSHEDDPVRAIKAALEIHKVIKNLSPSKKIGRPLAMHTGINTGVVITNAIDLQANKDRLLGDSINVASRLTSLAQGGEIIVGKETYRQAERFFDFQPLGIQTVKGKNQPIAAFKVLSAKSRPLSGSRRSTLQAKLIGRDKELAILAEQARLIGGEQGSVVCCVSGEVGIGKSRLVQEFHDCLDLERIDWWESQAYAYTQNVPYYPLVDLFNHIWGITKAQPKEEVQKKIQTEVRRLLGENEDASAYIESLYGLSLPKKQATPELWKSQLCTAVKRVIGAIAQTRPTVICFEDIHWADPSTIDLLRNLFADRKINGLFLCVYRPPFSLFTSDKSEVLGDSYRQIRLRPLEPPEVTAMITSMLDMAEIPDELSKIAQEKSQGNPFYLEEMIKALIESQTIVQDGGAWRVALKIKNINMPSTITGVIASRLDYLGKDNKRLIQEASVIGRSFLYPVLTRITQLGEKLDRCLADLEEHDLIFVKAREPELEYMFRHTLTHDVAYRGMLKSDRQLLHGKIGDTLESLFPERLPEFYEILAFQYKRGRRVGKAAGYLIKSGVKNLQKYSVEEAHRYFEEAFQLLDEKKERSRDEDRLLIDALTEWALALFYRKDFKTLMNLLEDRLELAESLHDKDRLGMFYGWLGAALWEQKRFQDAYRLLHKALSLGKETRNKSIIAHAYAWISYASFDLALFPEAIETGNKALKLMSTLESDNFLYYSSLSGRLVTSMVSRLEDQSLGKKHAIDPATVSEEAQKWLSNLTTDQKPSKRLPH